MESWKIVALGAALLTAGGCSGSDGGPRAPAALSYPGGVLVAMAHVSTTPRTPSVQGTVDQYAVSPALPPGLAIDPTTGVLAGTPTQITARQSYAVTASNAYGSVTAPVVLDVVAPPRFAYAASAEDSTIERFAVDVLSGRLDRRGALALPPGEVGPARILLHPTGTFAYVPNGGSSNLSVLAIDPDDGRLTPLPPFDIGAGPHAGAFTPDGRFLYLASRGASHVAILEVDRLDGSPEQALPPVATASAPIDLVVDAAGECVFVVLRDEAAAPPTGSIQVFAVDPLAGGLSPLGAAHAFGAAAPSSVAVDPLRDYVYVTLEASGEVEALAFDRATGALSPVATDRAASGLRRLGGDGGGRFAIVANHLEGTLQSYRVDAPPGDLVPAATADAGSRPIDVELDPAGRFAYVVDEAARNLLVFQVDPVTCALVQTGERRLRRGPASFAIARGERPLVPRTRSLHVLNATSMDVSAYTVDADGQPTEVHPTTPTGWAPTALAIEPSARYAYVADAGDGNLLAYAVGAGDGRLSPVGGPIPVGGAPWWIAVEPSGRFLHCVARTGPAGESGRLSTWSIDLATGLLALVDERPTAGRPNWVGCEPTGTHLYVTNAAAPQSITAYLLDPATGVPSASGAPVPAPGVAALGFHPNGRWAYAVLRSSNTILLHNLDPQTGTPELVPGGSRAGREPTQVVFSPDGRHAYATYQDSAGLEDGGHVTLFDLDPSGRLATPGLRYLGGTQPVDLVLDPRGRFLYVANRGTNDVSVMEVDAATGGLTLGTPATAGLAPRAIALVGEDH